MKEQVKKMHLAVLGLVFAASAFADHTGGSIDALVSASRNLNQTVNYSYLRYHVKSAVYGFSNEVEQLDRCADGRGFERPELMDHGTNDHTGGVPPQCQYQLNRVRASFSQVERYLYDTYYDFPQVYQAYQYTRSALFSL